MDGGFADPIRAHGYRSLLHRAQTAHWTSERDKFRPRGLLQQRQHGLEKAERADRVDGDVVCHLDHVRGRERSEDHVLDRGVGDDDVQVRDAVRAFEGGGGVFGGGGGGIFDLDGEIAAVVAFGCGGKGVARVGANACDDRGVGLSQIALEKGQTDA